MKNTLSMIEVEKKVKRMIYRLKMETGYDTGRLEKDFLALYRHQILALLEEIKAELPKKKEVKYLAGRIEAHNLGYNSAIKEMREKLDKMIKNLGEEIL